MPYIVMKNELGRRRRVPVGFSWSTLALGFFVPLARGHWGQFLRSLILSVCSLGIYWLVHPFVSNALYRSHLYSRGYRPVALAGIELSELERGLGFELRDFPVSDDHASHFSSANGSDEEAASQGFLKRRWPALVLTAIAIISITLQQIDSARLDKLRETDPAAYLAEIENQPDYMDELQALDPAKYEAIIDNQWNELNAAGRVNSSDYVEKFLRFMIVPEDKLVSALQSGTATPYEVQKLFLRNDLNERTIPYAKDRIKKGDFDILIESGVVSYISGACKNEPGYERSDISLADALEVKPWPLLDKLDRDLESAGFAPFAKLIHVGTFLSFDGKTLPRSYLPEPDDLSASCAKLRSLVTQNRFYDKWDVESPELVSPPNSSNS